MNKDTHRREVLTTKIDVLSAEFQAATHAVRSGEVLRTSLGAQATALDSLFHLLGREALEESSILAKSELMRLALRAQAQFVLTAKVLTEIPRSTSAIGKDLCAMGDDELNALAALEGSSEQ